MPANVLISGAGLPWRRWLASAFRLRWECIVSSLAAGTWMWILGIETASGVDDCNGVGVEDAGGGMRGRE